MSYDISPRLWWDGRRGVARDEGVTVELTAAPAIAPHLAEIDFAPPTRTAQLRESGKAWRDMTTGEMAAARALLVRVQVAAHAALEATP